MNKRKMREAAIERLRHAAKHQTRGPLCADDVTEALVGDGWVESSVEEDVEIIIELLTDDEPQYEGDAFAKGPRDADGILWFSGDMSDSVWGVIERTYFNGERWMVCGHDISAPWIAADSIRHAPIRTATQQEDDLIKLPKDANNKVINLWDKITYHGPCEKYQDRVFEVRGYGARAGRPIDSVIVLCDSHLETLTAYYCKHYHKPTVGEILDELEGMRGTGDYDDVVERCADLAGMLRELLKEGEDE